jgi:hypothetical protein
VTGRVFRHARRKTVAPDATVVLALALAMGGCAVRASPVRGSGAGVPDQRECCIEATLFPLLPVTVNPPWARKVKVEKLTSPRRGGRPSKIEAIRESHSEARFAFFDFIIAIFDFPVCWVNRGRPEKPLLVVPKKTLETYWIKSESGTYRATRSSNTIYR